MMSREIVSASKNTRYGGTKQVIDNGASLGNVGINLEAKCVKLRGACKHVPHDLSLLHTRRCK